MGDARIRLLPMRVVEVVHGFPVVDQRYHGLNIRFFRRSPLTSPWKQDLSISSKTSLLIIETQHHP